MIKTANLILKTITYTGDSIGENIGIEVEVANNLISMNRRIRNGSSIQCDKNITEFVTDGNSLTVPLTIRIIEKDLLFNDVGSTKENIKINFNAKKTQHIAYQVDVSESWGFPIHRTASFHVVFEVLVVRGIMRYVSEIEKGWLGAKKVSDGGKIDLPSFLKVIYHRVQSNREYCTILEGALSGVEVSLKLNDGGTSYLLQKNQQTEQVSLTYSISKKILKLGKKTLRATDEPDMRWKKGMYDVEIPDHPHEGGHRYPEATLATIWFRVGHSGDRYIHTGKHSLGCITLIEQKKWDALCAVLLKARRGDGRSVGTLEVID